MLLLAVGAITARAETPRVSSDAAGGLAVRGSLGHSHNDYAQAEPLVAALRAGALGIEADVFPVDGELLVAHDREDARPGKTLRSMYLAPLFEAFERLGGADDSQPFRGRVRESGSPVVLLIDFKADGERSWELLERRLAEFPGLCRRVRTSASGEAVVTEGPLIVVVSGKRPVETITAAADRRSAIDGRYPADLKSDRPAHLMPMVSVNAGHLLPIAAKEPGGMPVVLSEFAQAAAAKGRLARAWATPDDPAVWGMLREAGMQLINTDNPSALAGFLAAD
ncbi:hypothetical protein [Pseudobythopirellula maris]|uniref:hypothetical protein n=1 Tax=Pseudobythopirellula maris TaxID=2527991 RepID=UPI0018D405B4|nr:hypothetical protein [Pseudobythopirellula maris]